VETTLDEMTCLLPERVVQLHPTTRCNLACAHCYSSSAPGLDNGLDPDVVVPALAALARAGYRVLSVSGGEPFIYPALAEIATEACHLGFRVNLVTNGVAVTPAKAAAVASTVSLAAVSLDGDRERHDVIRAKVGAFDLALRGMQYLRAAGVPFGVITCVTKQSLADVPSLYEIAESEGARLFQLRPLALTGRAARDLEATALDAEDLVRLGVAASALAGTSGPPAIQCDLAPTQALAAEGRGQFPILNASPADQSLSALVNPLVVCEDGAVLPFAYGISRRYRLASIDSVASGEWSNLDDGQRTELVHLLDSTFTALEQDKGPLVDWFSLMTSVSHQAPLLLRPRAST
jgi:organic radical activating enzyme